MEEDDRRDLQAFLRQDQAHDRECLILYSDRRGERVESVEPPELQPDFVRTTAKGAWEEATPIDMELFERLRAAGWVPVRQCGIGATTITFEQGGTDDGCNRGYSIGGYAFERSVEREGERCDRHPIDVASSVKPSGLHEGARRSPGEGQQGRSTAEVRLEHVAKRDHAPLDALERLHAEAQPDERAPLDVREESSPRDDGHAAVERVGDEGTFDDPRRQLDP